MKKYLLLFAFFSFSINLLGQSNPNWLYFADGREVTCIEEDSTYIWVGTTAGLVQINKANMQKTFINKVTSDIPFNIIKKIYFDRQHRMWIIGDAYDIKLAMYDGTQWISFRLPEFGYQRSQEISDIVQAPDGTFWVGDSDGLIYFENNFQAQNGVVEVNDTSFIYTDGVSSLEADEYGNIYYGGYSGAVKKRDSTGFIGSWYSNGLANGDIVFLEKDGQGMLWAGSQYYVVQPSTGGGEVSYLTGNSWSWLGSPAFIFSSISDVAFGNNGEIYVATAAHGVVMHSNSQLSYLSLNRPEVDTNWTTAVHQDMDGDLWFGTLTGLYRMQNNIIQKVNVSNSDLKTNTFSIFQKKDGTILLQGKDPVGDFQIPTTTTLFIKDQDTLIPSITTNKLGILWKYEDANQDVWGIRGSALYRLSDTSLYSYIIDSSIVGSYPQIYDFCYDSVNQKFWLGSNKGLFSFANNNFNFEGYFMNQPSYSIRAVFADSTGALWAGSNGASGVAVFKNNSWTSHNYSWTLFNSYINSIVEDRNNAIWFVTNDGKLGRYSNNSWKVYNHLNSPLNQYSRYAPVFDKNNTLYLMDPRKGIRTLKNNVWDSIMIDNSNIECKSTGLFFDNNENLWIFGNGITIYNPDGIVMSIEEETRSERNTIGSLVYPNPSTKGFFVKVSDASQYPLKLSLYTIDGKLILTQTINSNVEISTDNLPSGIYMIKVEDVKMNIYVDKLVIGE